MTMRRALLSSLTAFLLSGPALADQSIPTPGAAGHGKGKSGWVGQCVARMERARNEVAAKDPLFAKAPVEAAAREVAMAGDPTAHGVVDVIEVRLSSPEFVARVEPYAGQPLANPAGWVRTAGPEVVQKYNYRPETERYGWLSADRTHPESARLFEQVFTRAIEDCLKMKKPR